jgi:hypothetical protein
MRSSCNSPVCCATVLHWFWLLILKNLCLNEVFDVLLRVLPEIGSVLAKITAADFLHRVLTESRT